MSITEKSGNMSVVQCENKHFYDNEKYKECPHCKRAVEQGKNPGDFAENKTVAKFVHRHDSNSDSILTKSLRNSLNNSNEVQKTVAKYFVDRNMNPIAGWLVCTEGENKGRSFEIHIGKNFVGRSMKMDIHTNDERISRENHFAIIYEPKEAEFYAVQGNGLTYFNGTILTDAEKLSEDDELLAGSSTYVFIPFCKKGRDWND